MIPMKISIILSTLILSICSLTADEKPKSIFNGNEYMQEPKRIAGKWIPIVPVYAYRTYVDGNECYWGLVRKLMDGIVQTQLVYLEISRLHCCL